MDAAIRRLRSEAERLAEGKAPRQVRYPDAFRRAVVALGRRRLGPDGSAAGLARALGVSEPTLTKWLRRPSPPVLRPVTVAVTPTAARAAVASLVLITPTGVRVEGLDAAALITVLRALA
jgi:transposase-like protein